MYTLAVMPFSARDAQVPPALIAAINETMTLFDLFVLVPCNELTDDAWAHISYEANKISSHIRAPVRVHQSGAAAHSREWSSMARRIGDREVSRRAGRPVEVRLVVDARDLDLGAMPGNLDVYIPPGVLVLQANDFPTRVRVHRPRAAPAVSMTASAAYHTQPATRDRRRTRSHVPAQVSKRDHSSGRTRMRVPSDSPGPPSGPPLVVLLGGPGSGKTTLGSTLALHLGGHHLSVGNVYRLGRDMHLYGWPQPWHPAGDPAWNWYQARVYGVVSRFCAERQCEPIILDGPTGDQVLELQSLCGRKITHIIDLSCSTDTMAQRLDARGRPEDANPAMRERRVTQYDRRRWHRQAGLRAFRLASPGAVFVQRDAELPAAEVAASIIALFGPAATIPGTVFAETCLMSLLRAEVADHPMPRPDNPSVGVTAPKSDVQPTADHVDSPSDAYHSNSPLYASAQGEEDESGNASAASPAYSPNSPSCDREGSLYPLESPPYSATETSSDQLQDAAPR